jgi:hypothetical protein
MCKPSHTYKCLWKQDMEAVWLFSDGVLNSSFGNVHGVITLQSTFSTIASLRKLNYVEQLCRVQSNPPHLNLITAWENYAQQTDITRVCVQLHKCSG